MKADSASIDRVMDIGIRLLGHPSAVTDATHGRLHYPLQVNCNLSGSSRHLAIIHPDAVAAGPNRSVCLLRFAAPRRRAANLSTSNFMFLLLGHWSVHLTGCGRRR